MMEPFDLGNFARTTEGIFSLEEFRGKLALGRPLRIKYGVDATAPFLHIGHAVNLWMMRELQEHGHKVVFLIGDFTTRIGDPTGKSRTRQVLSRDEIDANSAEYINQVGQILLTSSDVFEVRHNSEWFGRMDVSEFMSLLSMVTYGRLIQRDMFRERIAQEQEIHMHEMLYPVLQGYDSRMLESDLTIVGTDQLFNEMMGRFLQEKFGQPPQIVLTTRITAGIDGREKQSKSLGNYIALTDSPRDKYGKCMRIPDALIVPYLEVYTTVPLEEIGELQRGMSEGQLNPMEVKERLAFALVQRYHGAEAAENERAWFSRTFSLRETPQDIPTVSLPPKITLLQALMYCDPGKSRSAIRRLVEQGGVRLNDQKMLSADEVVNLSSGDVIRVGTKQWFRVHLAC